MKMELTDLIKVSTFAQRQGVSVQWVYQMAKRGDITLVLIDGVKFVKMKAHNLSNARL